VGLPHGAHAVAQMLTNPLGMLLSQALQGSPPGRNGKAVTCSAVGLCKQPD